MKDSSVLEICLKFSAQNACELWLSWKWPPTDIVEALLSLALVDILGRPKMAAYSTGGMVLSLGQQAYHDRGHFAGRYS